jgi:hypothetical protein
VCLAELCEGLVARTSRSEKEGQDKTVRSGQSRSFDRFSTISCWRNRAFSITRSAQLRVKPERRPETMEGVAGFVTMFSALLKPEKNFVGQAVPKKS